jgi:uncharacterized protein
MNALRRILWQIGAPARAVLLGGIRLYQATLSGAFGAQCRFYPSCSHYAQEAVRTHGAARGSAMAAWRIMRCQPFGRGGFEPVVPRHDHRAKYEEVIHGAERVGR